MSVDDVVAGSVGGDGDGLGWSGTLAGAAGTLSAEFVGRAGVGSPLESAAAGVLGASPPGDGSGAAAVAAGLVGVSTAPSAVEREALPQPVARARAINAKVGRCRIALSYHATPTGATRVHRSPRGAVSASIDACADAFQGTAMRASLWALSFVVASSPACSNDCHCFELPLDESPDVVPSARGPSEDSGVDAGRAEDAAVAASCKPVPQWMRERDSGLLQCGPQETATFLVDQLPERCDLIGGPWPQGDAGVPVPCDYDCVSGWCDPVTDACLLVSECVVDGDCAAGDVCLCSSMPGWGFNKCVPGNCRSSDACGDFACAVSADICGVPEAVACHTEDDKCQQNSDCDSGFYCAFSDQRARWECARTAICD